MKRVAGLALALAFPSVAAAQAEEWERFGLYTGCRPVHAGAVVMLSEDNQETMEDALEAVAEASLESRLRAADLWWSSLERGSLERVPLFAKVTVDPMLPPSGLKLYAYEVRLELHKQLMDEFGNKRTNTNATWTRVKASWEPPHPRSGQEVLDAVSSTLGRLMDQFIAAYLRVNGSAC